MSLIKLAYDGRNQGAVGINLVTEGDSVTYGYGLNREDTYWAQLKARHPSWSVSNNGVSGSVVAGMVSRATSTDAFYSSTFRFNILCVMIGINDLFNAGGTGAPPATVWTDLKAYLAARRSTGWKIVLGTNTDVQGTSSRIATYETDRQTLHNLIKNEPAPYDELALTGSDLFVGLHKPAVDLTFMQADGVHPNRDGATRIANIFDAAISNLMAKLS